MTVHDFDQGHMLAVIRQNPKRASEGALQYVQRIAVLAGLIRPEDTSGEPVDGWSNPAEVLEEAKPEWWQR